MRFKRYKKRKSRSVAMRFQSFVDLSTEADNMKIISVSAGGKEVLKRLSPFFSAYRYYKLGSVSIKLVPASTLPIDPTGLSYEAGENTVDPRDQMTPGMCRITNGEDILEDISGLTGDQQRQLYDNMILDPRWFKWMLQTGVKRYGKPRYWQVGQLHQDKWPGSTVNMPGLDSNDDIIGTYAGVKRALPGGITEDWETGSNPRGLFQTGRRGVLGWLPTSDLQPIPENDGTVVMKPLIASPVEVELFKILLPPMHKTNYFYRLFISEVVLFKDPVVLGVNGSRPLDVFASPQFPIPRMPQYDEFIVTDAILKKRTGGNDGSD